MSKLFDIKKGILHTDLDTPYCFRGNKIDVYSSVYWSAKTKKEYVQKEKLIFDYKIETDLFILASWCDVSGFDYWVKKQEEPNYVSIDVWLKKRPEQYTQEEIQIIQKAIIEADNYFEKHLLD